MTNKHPEHDFWPLVEVGWIYEGVEYRSVLFARRTGASPEEMDAAVEEFENIIKEGK